MIGPLDFDAAVEALRAVLAPGADEPGLPDVEPMRIESRAVTVIEDGAWVERARWVWVCPCHEHVSGPWLDRPTDANAWAEHDQLLGGAR